MSEKTQLDKETREELEAAAEQIEAEKEREKRREEREATKYGGQIEGER